VCVGENVVILFGFLRRILLPARRKSATRKLPQNNENWFCYFAYFRRLSSWLRPFCGGALGGGFLLPAQCYCCCIYLAAGGSLDRSHKATQPHSHPSFQPANHPITHFCRLVLSHKIQNVNTSTSRVLAARTRLYSKRHSLPI